MNDQPPEYLQGNIDYWQREAANYVKCAEDAAGDGYNAATLVINYLDKLDANRRRY